MWYFTPYIFLSLAAVLLALGAMRLAWPYRQLPVAKVFLGMMFSTIWWSLCHALELSNATIAGKVLLSNIQYMSVVSVPLLWLLFALFYTDRAHLLPRSVIYSLILLQSGFLIGAWTNGWHRLMWPTVELTCTAGGLWVLTGPYGPLWYASVLSAYAMVFTGTVLMINQAIRSQSFYRAQTISLVVGALLPWAASILFVTGLSPIPFVDLTPVAFALGGPAFTVAMQRYRALDLLPVAREMIVDQMPDAIIVLDMHDRIIDLNPAAQAILSLTIDALGHPLAHVAPRWLIEQVCDRYEGQFEVQHTGETGITTYALRCTTLRDRDGRPMERIFVLRDITLFKQAAQALQEAKEAAEANYATFGTLGPLVEQSLGDLVVEKLFLAAESVDSTYGVTDSTGAIAYTKRALARAARRIILLAASSKWQRRGFIKVLPLAAIETIITDTDLPETELRRLEMAGVRVVLV
ncbi:histidine kinase N-terminal 7TM domain-containing protein [Chloroflexus sp.]|uniref:histidine kinase N-terminal 7TM domain-containing protein n=1 Tax=Chloroflexus sp. TaxID=1904827 RepID=UPI004049F41E